MWRRAAKEYVTLKDAVLLSKGSERACYVHPLDPGKCIKVSMAGGKQHRRERRYFRSLARRKVPWRHMPEFFGTVDTDRGEGLVFSLIRDYDGAVSSSLSGFVGSNGQEPFRKALEAMKAHFQTWNIITCDMSLNNFMVQRTSPDSISLVMIDGLGNREFIPWSSMSAFLGRVKMRRRWKKFDAKLARTFGPSEL